MAGLSNALEDHAHDFVDRSQSGQAAVPRLNSDFNCTAESGVGGRAESEGGAVPVWSPSVPSQSQLQASVECLVPEVAKTRQGSLSRRLTQPTPRLNQDATAPNKVWHLMSNSIISIVLKVWSWSNKNCVIFCWKHACFKQQKSVQFLCLVGVHHSSCTVTPLV
jgi:hypothetical protein